MSFKKYILACLLATPCLQATSAELVLRAPAESNDGTYVLRLSENDQIVEDGRQVELFRNLDGGEFRLLMSVPVFKSLSQLVLKPGVYGYKVRWEGELGFSEPVFVKVNTRSGGMLSNLSKDKPSRELELGSR